MFEEQTDDTITLKRSHLYLVLFPLAFFVGLVVGYLAWGRGDAAAPEESDEQSIIRYQIPIEANDPQFGPEDAPITIIEYSDFECPYCRQYSEEVYPSLLEGYDGQIHYVFKNFPLTSIHDNALSAAEAAMCAQEQGAFWQMHDLLFAGELGQEFYEQYAAELDLDLEAFTACLDEHQTLELIQADYGYAIQLGVRSTPTFFINGIPLEGVRSYALFVQIIEGDLAGEFD